jgi:hypothetical protein
VNCAVDNFARQSSLLKSLRNRLVAGRYRFGSLCLLVLLTLVGGSTAARAEVQNSAPVTSTGPGPQFAIEDFDGDLLPDVARIDVGRTDSSLTDYWIHLELTAVGRQSIQVTGPAGGLSIEARDVNGDHAVDLVLATAWFKQPVAILLNNGHGGFSRVEPASFPGAFSESKIKWASVSYQATEVVGIPPQSGAGIRPEARCLLRDRSPAGSIPASSSGFLASPFLLSRAGRAPPSEVLHS